MAQLKVVHVQLIRELRGSVHQLRGYDGVGCKYAAQIEIRQAHQELSKQRASHQR
jgi:hypothetical protein